MQGWFGKNQTNYLIIIWILILLNLLVVVRWAAGISLLTVTLFVLLGVGGILGLLFFDRPASGEPAPEITLPGVKAVMDEFRPIAEQIFEKVLVEKSAPVTAATTADLDKSLNWLGEIGHKFGQQILEGLNEVKRVSFPSSGVGLTDEMYLLQRRMEERVDSIYSFLDRLESSMRRRQEEMEMAISRQLKDLRDSLESEKGIIYRYLENLLTSQLSEGSPLVGDELVVSRLDRMTDQFTVLIEKSLDSRLERLEENLVSVAEELLAKSIGEMQKESLLQVNGLKHLSALLEQVMTKPKTPLERLGSARSLLDRLAQEASDVMVTLAWQDVLIEKRWQEIKEKLESMQRDIYKGLEAEKRASIYLTIAEEIPEFSLPETREKLSDVLQSLVVAEALNMNYREGDEESTAGGAYVIFQFIRALEQMAREKIGISGEMLVRRRLIRDETRAGSYSGVFEKVFREVETRGSGLEGYLVGLYPDAFHNFCLNPGVRHRPASCGQAGWMLYLDLLDDEEAGDTDLYYLIGLLLVSHTIRNRYIHPSNSSMLIKVEHPRYVEQARFCSLTAISLLAPREIPY